PVPRDDRRRAGLRHRLPARRRPLPDGGLSPPHPASPTETMPTDVDPTAPVTAPRRSGFQPVIDTALRIRAFETALLDLFKQGLLSGTVHTCVGQEFCAAALHPHLRKGVDAFFATHRGHGHYLASGGPEDALLAELMG